MHMYLNAVCETLMTHLRELDKEMPNFFAIEAPAVASYSNTKASQPNDTINEI